MTMRPAAGGGRWVEVAPARLRRWLDGFARRHGRPEVTAVGGGTIEMLRLTAPDGAVAECHVPFPPLEPAPEDAGAAAPGAGHAPAAPGDAPASPPPADAGPGGPDLVERLIAHANRPRRVGVLLVRLGGFAAGVFDGERLVASKVGARHVQGRTAAGGWSQQRFARRREKQANEALRAAADVAARVLAPRLAELHAVVLGGDRRAVDALRGDPRLAGVFALAAPPFLTVPDPKLAVLESTPALFRAVRIRVLDPD
ncbi:acVLRF1 family peptidyl-tRNA hydrolase [Thermopolyspora flexuosa]|uniref:acVLRF1 family peptidyl-tRNA hydrolase n=1 Tax=Thermopolyspora flexuosa TaxID=103836 RepID=UPI0011506C24|nr:acVLRF1 family peptidyl-tRNA hydrolase [Thermopolyspora flexuosa]